MGSIETIDLGTIRYLEALSIQHQLRARRQRGEISDTLLVLEHPPVYTRGRRSEPGDLPFGEAWYAERGIEIVDVDRGGKVTYHGPGQLVVYAICRVGDVKDFVCRLERSMVGALAAEGIDARGRSGEGIAFTGAWVENRKIGSIGLHISHGVSTHGLSVNVDCDLEPFGWITACGLPDAPMTSILAEQGSADMNRFRTELTGALQTELANGGDSLAVR